MAQAALILCQFKEASVASFDWAPDLWLTWFRKSTFCVICLPRAYGFFTVSAYLLLYVRTPCVVFPLVYRLSLWVASFLVSLIDLDLLAHTRAFLLSNGSLVPTLLRLDTNKYLLPTTIPYKTKTDSIDCLLPADLGLGFLTDLQGGWLTRYWAVIWVYEIGWFDHLVSHTPSEARHPQGKRPTSAQWILLAYSGRCGGRIEG